MTEIPAAARQRTDRDPSSGILHAIARTGMAAYPMNFTRSVVNSSLDLRRTLGDVRTLVAFRAGHAQRDTASGGMPRTGTSGFGIPYCRIGADRISSPAPTDVARRAGRRPPTTQPSKDRTPCTPSLIQRPVRVR